MRERERNSIFFNKRGSGTIEPLKKGEKSGCKSHLSWTVLKEDVCPKECTILMPSFYIIFLVKETHSLTLTIARRSIKRNLEMFFLFNRSEWRISNIYMWDSKFWRFVTVFSPFSLKCVTRQKTISYRSQRWREREKGKVWKVFCVA